MTTLKSVPLLKFAAVSLGFLLPVSPALCQSTAEVGALQGHVTDAQGNPLAGAQVRYWRSVKTVVLGKGQPPVPSEAVVHGVEAAVPEARAVTWTHRAMPSV